MSDNYTIAVDNGSVRVEMPDWIAEVLPSALREYNQYRIHTCRVPDTAWEELAEALDAVLIAGSSQP